MSAQPNFNPIARPYRYLEYLALGPILQRCRTYYLPQLLGRKRALVLGDGDGRFLAALLTVNRTVHADAVDISPAMLHLLRQRCHAGGARLITHNQSIQNFTPGEQTDLVTAHFVFDCLRQSELDQLVDRYTQRVRPDALWLISDFRIPTGCLRLPARLYIRALYLAFRILTGLRITHLPDYEAPLRRAGLTCLHQRLSLFGLLTTELWAKPGSVPELSPF